VIGVGDTIAAIASATGPAGVGVIRLSGPAAGAILARLSGRPVDRFADRRLTRARLRAVDGALLDDVLCVVMRAPRSFTGEDVVELHGHGGAVNLGRLLGAVLDAGARLAEPGEFSRRALAAGKLDLVQAEALLAVVEASSAQALRVAQAQLAGGLGARIDAIRAEVVELLAELEAAVDFPEEGLGLDAGGAALASRLGRLAAACEALVASHAVGRVLRHGIEVALRGPVNAGKSSLFNALLGTERALVAAEPGTTRDFVEARAVWDGVAVTLIDTAGERETDGELERRGIALGARRSAAADVELWLVPAGGDSSPPEPPAAARRLVVWSKADLGGVPAGALAASAVTGAGVEALRAAIVERVTGGRADVDGDAVVTTERQRRTLELAGAALERALGAAAAGRGEELVALELREARGALDAVLGRGADDAVLDALFARFCIGK
jgi:tRNA modification GTPase